MYRLKILNNGLYQIHSRDMGAFEGTPNIIKQKAIEIGIQPEELNYAENLMKTLGDDIAEFGYYGTFLFTDKRGRGDGGSGATGYGY